MFFGSSVRARPREPPLRAANSAAWAGVRPRRPTSSRATRAAGQRGKGQLVAAGDHGGQEVGLHLGGEHQQVPLRRLLQGLEQGVGRGVVLGGQGLRRLDEHHPPAAAQGRVLGEAAQLPDLLDLDLGLVALGGGAITRKSGCVPAASRRQEGQIPAGVAVFPGRGQFRAAARARAVDAFPTPSGPRNR